MADPDHGAGKWFTAHGNGVSFTELSREGAPVAWSFRLAVLLIILAPGFGGGFTLPSLVVQVGAFAAAMVAFRMVAQRHS